MTLMLIQVEGKNVFTQVRPKKKAIVTNDLNAHVLSIMLHT